MPKRNFYKVVLIGNLGVGKTSMFHRLQYGDKYDHSAPRDGIGVDKVTKKFTVDSEAIFLDIWDTAGLEGFKTVTRSYYHDARVVVLVYDVTTSKSIYDLRDWLREAQDNAPNAVQVIIGNKFDVQMVGESVEIDRVTAEEFANNNDIQLHYKVSVKTNEGIQETFQDIARCIHKGEKLNKSTEGRDRQPSFFLRWQDDKTRKSTCSSCSRN